MAGFLEHPIDTTVRLTEEELADLKELIESAFDLTDIQNALNSADRTLDNIQFTLESDIKMQNGDPYRLDFNCKFKDTPSRGELKIKLNELGQIFYSSLMGWEDFECNGADYGWDLINGGKGFSMECNVDNPVLFNLIMTKPDHLFWCIDQSATSNELCRQFSWS
jgi:hypothetical protein